MKANDENNRLKAALILLKWRKSIYTDDKWISPHNEHVYIYFSGFRYVYLYYNTRFICARHEIALQLVSSKINYDIFQRLYTSTQTYNKADVEDIVKVLGKG